MVLVEEINHHRLAARQQQEGSEVPRLEEEVATRVVLADSEALEDWVVAEVEVE